MFFMMLVAMRLTMRLAVILAMMDREIPGMLLPDPGAQTPILVGVFVAMVAQIPRDKAIAEEALLVAAAAVPVEATPEVAARWEARIIYIFPDLDGGLNNNDPACDHFGGRRLFDNRDRGSGRHDNRSRCHHVGRPHRHHATPYEQ